MKKIFILALAAALVGGAAYANFCARDYVPASTLLVPYAVVALGSDGTPDPSGYTTLVAVTNVSSEAQIIHLTVWNARSSTVVDFDEVLTGYDVWTMNCRDLLNGRFDVFDTGVPSYGFWDDGSQTFGAKVTGPTPLPWGPTSNANGLTINKPQDIDYPGFGFSSCQNPPYGNLSTLSGAIISKIKSGIKAVPYGYVYCKSAVVGEPPWVANLTTNPLFFYITIDVTNACTTSFPNQSSYWSGHIPASKNVLIGDVIYTDTTHNYSESIPAVSIESSPAAATSGIQTFYGRYSGATGVDDREPLGTAFAFRYLNFGGVSTSIRVWKNRSEVFADDSTNGDPRYGKYLGLDTYIAYACDPFLYYAWDENENVRTRGGGPSGFSTNEPNPLPYETQDAPVNDANFNGLVDTTTSAGTVTNGWMLLVMDPSVPNLGTVPYSTFPPLPQAWVGVKYNYGGFTTMNEAATMANAHCFPTQVLPNLGINYVYPVPVAQ